MSRIPSVSFLRFTPGPWRARARACTDDALHCLTRVLPSLQPFNFGRLGRIGEETHHVDQTLIFTSGTAKAIVNGEERNVGAGDIVIVPVSRQKQSTARQPSAKRVAQSHSLKALDRSWTDDFLLYDCGQAGCKHNFIVTSGTPLILFTSYAPAEHNEKTVHKTKEEGDELEDAGKDEPPSWAKKD